MKHVLKLAARHTLAGKESVLLQNLGEATLVVRLVCRNCVVQVPSNIAILEPMASLTLEITDGGSTGGWNVQAEVLNTANVRSGNRSAGGLTADLRRWLGLLESTAEDTDPAAVAPPAQVRSFVLKDPQALYEKAKRYLARWGLYWLRLTILEAARAQGVPPPHFLQPETFARHFRNYAESIWVDPSSVSSRRFSQAIARYMDTSDDGQRASALDGALRGYAIAYAEACCTDVVHAREALVERLGELVAVAQTRRFEKQTALLSALQYALAPSERRWREVERSTRYGWDGLDPTQRSTPMRVLQSLRDRRRRDVVALACFQAAIEQRANTDGTRSIPSMRWLALGTLLFDERRWASAATAFDRASANATHEHSIEVSGIARGALARAQAIEEVRPVEASEHLLAVRSHIQSSFPSRDDARYWASRLHEEALVLQLKSLDYAVDLEEAERTCRELSRVQVDQTGKPGALVGQVRARLRFYQHLRKGEFVQAEEVAAALSRISTDDARPRLTNSVVLGLCAAAIGSYSVGKHAEFLRLAADARDRVAHIHPNWDRIRRLTTACQVVSLMERRVMQHSAMEGDEELYLRNAVFALDEDADLTSDTTEVWRFLLEQLLVVLKCRGMLPNLVGTDLLQHLRATARLALSLTVGAAKMGKTRIEVVDAMRARQDWLTLPPELGHQFEELEAIAGNYAGAFAVTRRIAILEGVLRLVLRGRCREGREGHLGADDNHVTNAALGELVRLGAEHEWPEHAAQLKTFLTSPNIRRVVEIRNEQAHARFDELAPAELQRIDTLMREAFPILLKEAPVVARIGAQVPAGTLLTLNWALVPRVVCISGLSTAAPGEERLLSREKLLQALESSVGTSVPESALLRNASEVPHAGTS